MSQAKTPNEEAMHFAMRSPGDRSGGHLGICYSYKLNGSEWASDVKLGMGGTAGLNCRGCHSWEISLCGL